MDITDTLAPNSDQMDAIDLVTGPRTFTVEKVTKGSAEQPVQVYLAEFPRPWRPSKSMLRVLAAAWTAESSTWIGRRLTLWCDPEVVFGREKVGGLRITAMSHLEDDKPKTVRLLVSRGKSAPYTVQPLAEQHVFTQVPAPSLKSQVWDRSLELKPDLDKEKRTKWIRDELASLGGDTPENLTALLSNWEAK